MPLFKLRVRRASLNGNRDGQPQPGPETTPVFNRSIIQDHQSLKMGRGRPPPVTRAIFPAKRVPEGKPVERRCGTRETGWQLRETSAFNATLPRNTASLKPPGDCDTWIADREGSGARNRLEGNSSTTQIALGVRQSVNLLKRFESRRCWC